MTLTYKHTRPRFDQDKPSRQPSTCRSEVILYTHIMHIHTYTHTQREREQIYRYRTIRTTSGRLADNNE